jgi:methionine-rich copper-binding protein CopC
MFMVGYSGRKVYEYKMTTAWDISTASFVDDISISNYASAPIGITFNGDGTKMYITGQTQDSVDEFNLSTGYQVTDDSECADAADTAAPTLSSSTPADNATSIALDANVVLNFNEAVDAESGNITIKKTSDNSTIATIGVTGNQVSGSGGTQITINPSSNFSYSTEYYVLIDATAFDDAAGNSYAGISSTTALSFTTVADTSAPTLSSSTPADNATSVAIGANIALTFNETVDTESGNITIKKTSDNSTVQTIGVTSNQVSGNGLVPIGGGANGTVITINPSSNLAYNTEYYVLIDATAFDDVAGNSYAGISSTTALSFTTVADTSNPSLSSSTPADNATSTSVSSNIVLNFSEAVDAERGNITIKKTSDNSTFATIDVTGGLVSGSGGTQITINPSSNFAELTEYYVLIDATAFDDGAGNSYAGISSTTALSFTTNDPTLPSLSKSTPTDDQTKFKIGNNIVLYFSEAVDVERQLNSRNN